jgi:hypothetical protein
MSVFGLFRKPNVESIKIQGDIGGLIEALGYQKNHSVRFAAALARGKIGDSPIFGDDVAAWETWLKAT